MSESPEPDFTLVSSLSPSECEVLFYELATHGYFVAKMNGQLHPNSNDAREVWVQLRGSQLRWSHLSWFRVNLLPDNGGGTRLDCRVVPSPLRWIFLACLLVCILFGSVVSIPGWCADVVRGDALSGPWWSVPNAMIAVYFLWRLRHLRGESAARLQELLLGVEQGRNPT